MARNELDSLHDDLFVLSCAVADTKRDLAASRLTAAELKDTVQWLLEAAEPLAARRISPSS